MTKGFARCTAIIAGLACVVSTGVEAGSVESSYRTARGIIEESMTATGAANWLDNGGAVLVESVGQRMPGAEHQGRNPTDESSIEFHETWAFDPDRGRLGREIRYRRQDGTLVWEKELYFDQRRLVIDLQRQVVTESQGKDAELKRGALLRRWVPTLLAEAEDNPAALRSIGRYGPFDGVSSVTHDGQSLSVFFGRESRTPGWIEYLADLPSFADSTVTWKFLDYRPVDDLGLVPHMWAVYINDRVLAKMEVIRATADRKVAREFLDLPTDMELAQRDSFLVSPAFIEELGAGAYRVVDVVNRRHVLLVEFEDHVLMVDAPAPRPSMLELPAQNVTQGGGEYSLSRQALKLAARAVPGKSVKAALLTHFHSDSVGGLRALGEDELLVYAHDSEAEAVQEYLEKEHTLCPETGVMVSTTLATVGEKLVLQDASQEMVIMNVGWNPHTDNMLVVWLPRQRILYTTDLLTAIDGQPDPKQAKLNRFFMNWLMESGLDPELILTAHGDGRMQMTEQTAEL